MNKLNFYIFFVFLSMLFGCREKEVTNFRFDKWEEYNINSFIPCEFRYPNITDNLRGMEVYYFSQDRQSVLIHKKLYENGLLREVIETPINADESYRLYYYDDNRRLIESQYLNWDRDIVPEYSYSYSYSYNKNDKEFIQTVYNNGEPIVRRIEVRTNSGYRLTKEYLVESYDNEIAEVVITDNLLKQYISSYGKVGGDTYFDLNYDNGKLTSILRRNISNGKEKYVFAYDVISYDEEGNIEELVSYNYDRSDKAKRTKLMNYFFSEYDDNGNWQHLSEYSYSNPDQKREYIRKFLY